MSAPEPAIPPARDEGVATAGILSAIGLIVVAATMRWGEGDWNALAFMLAANGLCIWLHLRPRAIRLPERALLVGMLIAMVAIDCALPNAQLADESIAHFRLPGYDRPLSALSHFAQKIRFLNAVALLVALTYLAKDSKRRRLTRGRFAALLLIALATRGLILRSSPAPRIDVWTMQMEAASGLGREARAWLGKAPSDEPRPDANNAYEISFEPVRLDPALLRSAPPGPTYDEGRVQVYVPMGLELGEAAEHYGYPYPPLAIYPAFIAREASRRLRDALPPALADYVAADTRWAWVICEMIAAILLFLLARRVRPGPAGERLGELLALISLFLPRALYVVERSWPEPMLMALLAALALAIVAGRGTFVCSLLMGLLFSAKQYVLVAAPLLARLRRVRWWGWPVGVAVGVACALPFLLWNAPAVWDRVVVFFLKSPTRATALSIPAAWHNALGAEMPMALIAPAWIAGAAFYLWAMRRTPAGWLFASGATWLWFFLFGKQAAMNYFETICFAMLLAVAATRENDDGVHGSPRPRR